MWVWPSHTLFELLGGCHGTVCTCGSSHKPAWITFSRMWSPIFAQKAPPIPAQITFAIRPRELSVSVWGSRSPHTPRRVYLLPPPSTLSERSSHVVTHTDDIHKQTALLFAAIHGHVALVFCTTRRFCPHWLHASGKMHVLLQASFSCAQVRVQKYRGRMYA